MAKKDRNKAGAAGIVRYTKNQLIGSEKYRDRRDLLWALLEDEKVYSAAEAEEVMNQFMKGKVKVC